jgi:hypothetical protein
MELSYAETFSSDSEEVVELVPLIITGWIQLEKTMPNPQVTTKPNNIEKSPKNMKRNSAR